MAIPAIILGDKIIYIHLALDFASQYYLFCFVLFLIGQWRGITVLFMLLLSVFLFSFYNDYLKLIGFNFWK